MKLTFLGGTHEVTGSCYYLEAAGKKLLIDCGMEQGRDMFENVELPIGANAVDCVLLTHAHIDHSGKLPLLYKQGFKGAIHATEPTKDLCDIMLKDSAHIQEFEAEWRNRKGRRAGHEEYIPLYTMDDALGAISLFEGHPYNEKIEIYPGIVVRFTDVGHLLGSASIEVWATEGDVTKKIVFSGDIGNINKPILRDPQYIKEADYVLTESTYGDRSHGPTPDYVGSLAKIINDTFAMGGNVVIPSFAVGRTQELLYFIREIKEKDLCPDYPDFPVYVDSPMAVEATSVFRENCMESFDSEALELVRKGINPISFKGLKLSVTSDDSRAINFDSEPKVIISASGMCEAGRIKHHLKHNLWRKECTILFVGYQAVNTLGRRLLEGVDSVKLFGETIDVEARIERLPGVSGHADHDGLLRWLKEFTPMPERVFVVHGDDEVMINYTGELRSMGYNAVAPYSGTCYDLLTNTCLYEARPVPIEKKTYAQERASSTYRRLVAMGKRLMEVIAHNEGGTNKDLARFADQIASLCDKWDRFHE